MSDLKMKMKSRLWFVINVDDEDEDVGYFMYKRKYEYFGTT